MTIAPDDAQHSASHLYRAMRDFVQSMDDTLPGKFEITKEGIVHDMMSPVKQHEFTALRLRKRLEKVMPDESWPTRAPRMWRTSPRGSCATPT